MKPDPQIFTELLLKWFDCHGRKNLPWQTPRTPYRVWLSEMMLQQTQVKTVIPYFNRFTHRFPDVKTLALASEDEVMAEWSGLGYYSRARHLHRTATIIHTQYHGQFPQNLSELCQLPGIGPSTAAAIASLAFHQPTAILDGNVRRVLSRVFGIDGLPTARLTQKKLWDLAQMCMSKNRCADYTQAIMDMGATCCKSRNPECSICPLKNHCIAYQTQNVSSYPTKKLKIKIPDCHQAVFLFYTTDHHIYLEKRDTTGIWGGLWCLPCIDIIDGVKPSFKTIDAELKPVHLTTVKHALTHKQLHLQIKTLCIQNKREIESIGLTKGRWFLSAEINQLGLPQPIKKIIDYFFQVYRRCDD